MDNGMVDKERVIDAQIENGPIEQTITGEIVSQPDQDRNPWNRQPDESSYWYDAFVLYRNLPPHNRSILAAYRQHRTQQGYAIKSDMVASGEWYKQSAARDWERRATLYDDYNRREAEERAKRAVQDWYVKSRFDLSHIWDDLQVEYSLVESGNMSKSQVIAATKTISQQMTPQSPSQSIDVQIILDNLPPDIQTALLERLTTR